MIRHIVRSLLTLVLFTFTFASPRPAVACAMIRYADLYLPVPDLEPPINERFIWIQSLTKSSEFTVPPGIPLVRFSHIIEDATLWTIRTEERLRLTYPAPTVSALPFTMDPLILQQKLSDAWIIRLKPFNPSSFVAIVHF